MLQPYISCALISQIGAWGSVHQFRYLPKVIQQRVAELGFEHRSLSQSIIANTDVGQKESHFLSSFLPFWPLPSVLPLSLLPSLSSFFSCVLLLE